MSLNQHRRWKVNGSLLPLKVHYFLQNGGIGVVWPFIPVIGRQLGLEPFHVGLIFGLATICILFIKPLVKLLKKQKTVFIIFLFLTFVSLISFTIIPKPSVTDVRPVQFECGNRGSNYIKQCSSNEKKTKAKEPLVCPSPEEWKLSQDDNKSNNNNNTIDEYNYNNNSYVGIDNQLRFKEFLANINNNARENNENSNNSSQTAISTTTTDKNEATCYVTCTAIDYFHLLDFCNNFDGPTLADLCATLKEELEAHEIMEQDTIRAFYYMQFETKLKIRKSNEVEDCLFLPIDRISFKSVKLHKDQKIDYKSLMNNMTIMSNETNVEDPGTDQLPFEKFSCQPNATLFTKCFANCPNNEYGLNSYLLKFITTEHPHITKEISFWFYFVLVVIAVVSIGILNSVNDSNCSQLVYDNPDKYGLQKLWGIAGYGLFCLLSGYFIDRISEGKIIKDYAPCFFLVAGVFTMDFVASFKLEIKQPSKHQSIWKDLQISLRDPRITLFMIDCIIMGICSGIHKTFLLWYIEELNEKGDCNSVSDWIKFLQGSIVAVQCLSEILFFTFAGWLLNKFGYFSCMSLILLMSSIQFGMYFLLSNPWSFLPLEVFQGIICAIFSTTMINYGSVAVSLSGRQNSPRIKQFFSIAFSIIGISTGSILGGYLFEEFGGKIMFLIISLSCLVTFCLHVGIVYCVNKKIDYGHAVSTVSNGNTGTNEQKMKRISRTDSQEFNFDFESDID